MEDQTPAPPAGGYDALTEAVRADAARVDDAYAALQHALRAAAVTAPRDAFGRITSHLHKIDDMRARYAAGRPVVDPRGPRGA